VASPSPSQGHRRPRQTIADLGNRYGLVVTWGVLIAIFGAASPTIFLSLPNLQTILSSQAILLVLAIGLLFPLMAGEFDISIAGVLGLSLVLVGYLNVLHHWPIVFAVAAALLVGLLVGAVNAFFVVGVGLPSFIVTLGTGTLLAGIGLGISNLTIIGISPLLVAFSRSQLFGLQAVFFYGLALTALTWYVLSSTPVGRYLYFVGVGREVARLAGVPVQQIRVGSFIGASLIGSIDGVLLAGVLGASNPDTGPSYLLPAFAAAFLGATAIVPGRFNAWGTFIAVYFLATGITGLEILGLSGWIEQVFYGSALVLAVTFSRLSARRAEHQAVREPSRR